MHDHQSPTQEMGEEALAHAAADGLLSGNLASAPEGGSQWNSGSQIKMFERGRGRHQHPLSDWNTQMSELP